MTDSMTFKKKSWERTKALLLSFVCLCVLGGCKDDGGVDMTATVFYPSDPQKAITFTDFTPDEGVVRTRVFISGENFGTDASLIHVTIGGQKARVVSSDGELIYCMVPPRADGGYIEVEIKNADGSKRMKHTFGKKFKYSYTTMVSTLCGVVDDKGVSAVTDGKLDVAGWVNPMTMIFDDYDGKRDMYIAEESNNCLRKIDLINEMVTTIVTKGSANWNKPSAMAWSPEKDTLYISNDQSDLKGVGIYYLLRKENFTITHRCVIQNYVNAILVHPTDGGLYYIRGQDAQLYKATFNIATQLWDSKAITSFGYVDQWFYNAVFHPDGDYVYCVSRNRNYIQKSMYNKEAKTLEQPNTFVGGYDAAGYWDAPGMAARFSSPIQGCFVKNEEYVRDGKEDVYDFYVADANNHCIRKVTPDGIVSTYAGRGSWSTDEIRHGYIDGDIRETARFDFPTGICYEPSTATFFISDNRNHRIRTIAVE